MISAQGFAVQLKSKGVNQMTDDNVQHGIDDNPTGDAEKGAALGGLGGAAVGAAAGSLAGPAGTVIGAVVGGLAGAAGSGAAVAAVDRVDNDNTVTGIGGRATRDANDTVADVASDTPVIGGHTARASSDDSVQHGIDDNPTGDAEKGAALGGLGGAGVGAAAGSMAGPVGTVAGAVVGGIAGAAGSGVAVAAVDKVDNDDTVTGVGDGATRDVNNR